MKDKTVYLKTEDIAIGLGLNGEEMKELLLDIQATFWFTTAGHEEVRRMCQAEQLSEFVFSLLGVKMKTRQQQEFYLKVIFEVIPAMRAEISKPSKIKANGEPRALTAQQRRTLERQKERAEAKAEIAASDKAQHLFEKEYKYTQDDVVEKCYGTYSLFEFAKDKLQINDTNGRYTKEDAEKIYAAAWYEKYGQFVVEAVDPQNGGKHEE